MYGVTYSKEDADVDEEEDGQVADPPKVYKHLAMLSQQSTCTLAIKPRFKGPKVTVHDQGRSGIARHGLSSLTSILDTTPLGSQRWRATASLERYQSPHKEPRISSQSGG